MCSPVTNRFIGFLILVCCASGCTTTVEIDYVDRRLASTLPSGLSAVSTVRMTDHPGLSQSEGEEEGLLIVRLRAGSDLRDVTARKEFAFVYFRLYACDAVDNDHEIYSAPVYSRDGELGTGKFVYYAIVPLAGNTGRRLIGATDASEDVCLGLGAGNMSGSTLTSNVVSIGPLIGEN